MPDTPPAAEAAPQLVDPAILRRGPFFRPGYVRISVRHNTVNALSLTSERHQYPSGIFDDYDRALEAIVRHMENNFSRGSIVRVGREQLPVLLAGMDYQSRVGDIVDGSNVFFPVSVGSCQDQSGGRRPFSIDPIAREVEAIVDGRIRELAAKRRRTRDDLYASSTWSTSSWR